MEFVEIEITSVEMLEKTIRDLDPRSHVHVSRVHAGNLYEAAVIYYRLKDQGLWSVDEETMKVLRRATEHYEALGLLEIQLDFAELDLEEGVTMKGLKFEVIREAANDVIISAHPSSRASILEKITIEAQRVARVMKALGFGALDVDFPQLMEEDIDWLAAGEEIQIGALDGMAHGLDSLHLDDQCPAAELEDGDGVEGQTVRGDGYKKGDDGTTTAEMKLHS